MQTAMKQLLSLLVALTMTIVLWAHPVDNARARAIASEFLNGKGCSVVEFTDITSTTPFREFYVFTFTTSAAREDNEGFILVSADDCVLPILAYSTDNAFRIDRMPAHIMDWLADYESQIAFCKVHDNGSKPQMRSCKSTVAPLLSTTWNQSPYYNNLCPYDNVQNGRSVTGCTATATAQIMKYWNYPTTGYGSHSYSTTNCGMVSANFGATTYNWTNMPNSLNAYSTSTQLNAVATLIFHVGVAVEMNYHKNSSGAATVGSDLDDYSAENALKNFFRYSPDLHSVRRADWSDAQWIQMLKTELDSSRPVLYSGHDTSGGHAFVLDGYNNSSQFHVNWGWGGYCDGYYAIGSLNPAAGGTGGNSSHSYNLSNAAVIGICPNNAFSTSATSVVTVVANDNSLGSVTGGATYQFGDTVTLRATASSGCRFNHWSDGSKVNPRQFIATGGNLSFTAVFEALSGDTLSYCTGNYHQTSLGGSTLSTRRWGVKFPASVLTPNHDLEKVQLYVATPGTYTLRVHVGSTYSSGLEYTETYTIGEAQSDSWNTFTLSTPVSVSGTQPLWIVFVCSDVNYPAAMTYNSGNSDALLWSSSLNSISATWDYSWMIRAIFSQSDIQPEVSVSGPTEVLVGQSHSYTATGVSQSPFQWQMPGATPATATGNSVALSWSLPGIYQVCCTATAGNHSVTDTLQVRVRPRHTLQFLCEGTGTGRLDTVPQGDASLCGQQLTVDDSSELHIYITLQPHNLLEHFYINGADCRNQMEALDDEQLTYHLSWLATASATIRAVYAVETFEFTVTSEPADGGSVTGAGTYAWHDTAWLEATPAEGYQFVGWRDGDQSNPRAVVVEADSNFVALFQKAAAIQHADALGLTLYPNPASDRAVVEWTADAAVRSLQLLSLDGRVLRQWDVPSSPLSLSLDGVAPGVYLLRVATPDAATLLKLVVTR